MGTRQECRHLGQWIQVPASVCTVKEEAESKGERLTELNVYVFFRTRGACRRLGM